MAETGREGFGKGGSEPIDLSEKNSYSVGSNWVYIFNRWKAKKEIPARNELAPNLLPLLIMRSFDELVIVG